VPYYYYEAATTEGRITKRILKARDKKDADHRLRESGLRPMLIENFKTVKKKKQEQKVLRTRHIIRNTLAVVTGVSLVCGVGAYLIIIDLSSIKGFDVQDLAEKGIVKEVAEGTLNVSDEERPFATEVWQELNEVYPDTFGGITIERHYLMLVYLKQRKNLTEAELRQVTLLITGAFGRYFDLETCLVLMVHDGKVEIF
jgi:hypothetical protein